MAWIDAGTGPKEWVLVSDGLFWRAGGCGYTSNIAEAGLFTKAFCDQFKSRSYRDKNIKGKHISEFVSDLHDAVAVAAEASKRLAMVTAKRRRLARGVIAKLDPGIRETVVRVNEAGFETTDSGDGVSKPADCRVFDCPHVIVKVSPAEGVSESHRLLKLLGDPWIVECSYSANDEACVLIARKD